MASDARRCVARHQGVPPPDWQSGLAPQQRVRARLIYVDPTTKRVCLSLKRHLVGFSLPEAAHAGGALVDAATVRRVDASLGLLLELPAASPSGAPAAGYAHISNLSDSRVEKAEKVCLTPRSPTWETSSSYGGGAGCVCGPG
jgi:rRNA biogenesis protein RRP5